MNARTVIVTDGDQRAALAVVRSLGAAGYRCLVVSPSGKSIAGASRYAERELGAPSPLNAPGAFADAVVGLARDAEATLLIPITEPAMLALLPAREQLDGCVIPFPGLATFRALSDKQRLLEEGAKLGIAVPTQVVVQSAASAPGVAAETLGYPLVLKPARSVG